jgi:lycopene beta-cyclase
MTNLSPYDYIIAGGGASGLSLLFHLLQSPLRNKSILVIDKSAKTANDRTWCFWDTDRNPFPEIVHHQWDIVSFHSQTFSKQLDLKPYHYKMIRGIDFYGYVQQLAAQFENVHFLQAEIEKVEEKTEEAVVHAEGQVFNSAWVFNSLRDPSEKDKALAHNYLLQHFKGWVIHTPQPFFDTHQATLMDFRVEQYGDCRFMYVLPTDPQTALVEYTLFSAELLPEEAYEQALISYLKDFFRLDDYTIEHEEFGIIPMTDMPYPTAAGKRIVNIGTAGGQTKPSTGYTFMRIQEDSRVMVEKLCAGKSPHRQRSAWQQRFMIYDSTLLNVMNAGSLPAWDIFTHLFRNNPPQRVFKFLDEHTRFWEEVLVANSVPTLPFLKGFARALKR